MKKRLYFLVLVVSLFLNSCASVDSSDMSINQNILLTVNNEPLYSEELNKISSHYAEIGLTETEIIEGMVLELITLQQAESFSISVSQNDIDSRTNELSTLGESFFYEKAMEQYGSEEKYKQSLYYKIIYDEVEQKIKDSFLNGFSLNQRVLQIRTNDYISQYTSTDFKENNINQESFYNEVINTYNEYSLTALEDLYFKVWKYKTASESNLVYVSYDGDILFQKQDYNITSDTLNFKNIPYELKDLSLEEIRNRFGNYFYFSNSLLDSYGPITGRAIHIPEKDVRGLYVTLGIDTPITVKIIVAPILSLYNNFEGNEIISSTENGINKIEYIQSDLGIYYSLSADMKYEELENIFNSSIPYFKLYDNVNTTDTPESSNTFMEYTPTVYLADGKLYLNECSPVANDMAYFNPDTARLEHWNTEQVIDYLEVSFAPLYIPKDLNPCTDSYIGSFMSYYENNETTWTVAYEEDLLVYDNFGIFYSNYFQDEYDPMQRNLIIEVSKNKVPESDISYSFDTTEISYIGTYQITVGLYKKPYYNQESRLEGYIETYVAEFLIDGVGYRIISENLSQDEFVNVLLSIPLFQQ